jgi:hypothetical protein
MDGVIVRVFFLIESLGLIFHQVSCSILPHSCTDLYGSTTSTTSSCTLPAPSSLTIKRASRAFLSCTRNWGLIKLEVCIFEWCFGDGKDSICTSWK